MGYETINFIYLSEILDLPVVDARLNRKIGRVVDVAAATGQVYPKTTGLITRVRGKKDPVYIPWVDVRKTTFKHQIDVDFHQESATVNSRALENEILLKKSFLDRQLISTSGYKLVRVNDLQMLVDNSSKENPNLWLVHIDIGVKGLLRRLGWVRISNAVFKWMFARDIRDKFISWKYIQPTTTTNVYGALRLTTDSSKLSEILPADLADIVEDLGTDERISLIESLDPATAAATLQEMPLKLRVQVADVLDTAKLAAIVNAMQMDETVDLLDEFPQERLQAVLQLLTPEKVSEIRELSDMAGHRAGSIMNTNFVTALTVHTVRDVLEIVKEESRKAELLYYIYILDDKEHLKGIVTLRDLLAADPQTSITDVMRENIVSVTVESTIKSIARLFFKYNFAALPVVDDEQRIQGIITLRDTLESVFPEVREESKG